MRFLKALQRSDVGRVDRPENGEDPPATVGVGSKMPDLIENSEIRIGRGVSPVSVGDQAAPEAEEVRIESPAAFPNLRAEALQRSRQIENVIYIDPERINPHVVAITQPHSPYCEEYRNLRTHLLQTSQLQDLQAVAVVSVAPSEGKSITALNLAWLLAQTDGVSALLIDGDLRLPSLARYLGIDQTAGLSGVLSGESQLMDAVIRLEPAGLHILPGGRARSDVAEQISGPKFEAIMHEARQAFDFVIIDAPPLSVFTDAKVLINHTDGALLVVRSNFTQYKDLDRVLESLPRERMLGTVLNDTDEALISSYYYDYGYYNKKGLLEN